MLVLIRTMYVQQTKSVTLDKGHISSLVEKGPQDLRMIFNRQTKIRSKAEWGIRRQQEPADTTSDVMRLWHDDLALAFHLSSY